jgi:uracil-DNA glycosylase family 4
MRCRVSRNPQPASLDPNQELSAILTEAKDYLNWLRDEGIQRLEIGRDPSGSAGKDLARGVARPPEPVAKPVTTGKTGEKTRLQHKVVPVSQARRDGSSLAADLPPDGSPDRDLATIAGEVAECRKCPLHKTRTNTVPGQGTPRPELMFVGEAPGADEDEQGLAFVGRAGQLLTKMIQAMGFQREDVFIANILKCRPPDNRQPLPEEMETCLPYLKAQIRALRPKVIVALGATAVRGLVGLDGITKLRGKWLLFEGIDLMPTYHPAYLLRNPPAKKDVWIDLQEVLKRLGRTPPPAKPA